MLCNKRLNLGWLSQERGRVHLGETALGKPQEEWVPGVLFAAATLPLLALGCQNHGEIPQIIKQLQCPVLRHWKCTFFLQVNFPSPPIKGDDLLCEHNKQLHV